VSGKTRDSGDLSSKSYPLTCLFCPIFRVASAVGSLCRTPWIWRTPLGSVTPFSYQSPGGIAVDPGNGWPALSTTGIRLSPRHFSLKRSRKPDDAEGHLFWRKQVGRNKEAHLM